jgi:hypothetical protein
MNTPLVEFLRERKEKAYKAHVLCYYVGGTARSLRQDVNELRTAGFPIISGDFGYMYTEDPEKIDRCIARLNATAFNTYMVSNALLSIKNKLVQGDSYGPLFSESDRASL